jgi:hypothetical protein
VERRSILAAHAAFLTDPDLIASAREAIAAGASAGFAWRSACRASAALLRSLGDPRMAERADDLTDIERQVLVQLTGQAPAAAPVLGPGDVLLADDLLPSQLMRLGPRAAGRDLHGTRRADLPRRHPGRRHGRTGASSRPEPAGTPWIARRHPEPGPRCGRRVCLHRRARRPAPWRPRRAALAAADRRAQGSPPAPPPREAVPHRRRRRASRSSPIWARWLTRRPRPPDAGGAEGCGLLRTEFLFLDRQTARRPKDEQRGLTTPAIAGGPERPRR